MSNCRRLCCRLELGTSAAEPSFERHWRLQTICLLTISTLYLSVAVRNAPLLLMRNELLSGCLLYECLASSSAGTYNTNKREVLNGTCPQVYHNMWTNENGATGACNCHVCLFKQSSEFDWMGAFLSFFNSKRFHVLVVVSWTLVEIFSCGPLTGYSIRTDTWRYTLHVEWDGANLAPKWNHTVSEELYDHSENDARTFDDQVSEPINLLGLGHDVDPKLRQEADMLRTMVQQHFSTDS